MSNNYSPFSTAPVARGAGMSATYNHQLHHHHHATSSTTNGLMDGLLPPPLGTLSTSVPATAAISRGGGGGGGGGMLPYPIPPPQSQQQHAASASIMNNCGPTGNVSVGMPSSGPAVPAPRSAATLLAEATGAPPPPPAPSRVASNTASMAAAAAAAAGLASGIAGTGAAAPLLGASPVPTMTPGLAALAPTTPESAAATSTAALVSPSFKVFTTSAAAMLSSMAEADGLADPVESAGSIAASSLVGAPVTAAGAAATATPLIPAHPPAINPHSLVEIKFTLPVRQERVDTNEGNAFGFEEESDDDEAEDMFAEMVMLICDHDPLKYPEETELKMRGEEWHTLALEIGDAQRAAAVIKREMSGLDRSDLCNMLKGLASAIVYHNTWSSILPLGIQEKATLRHLVLRIVLTMLVKHRCAPREAEQYVAVLVKMLTVGWVSMKGTLDTVELCLQHDELIYIGLRIIEYSFHKSQRVLELRTALAARPGLARRLAELYATDPRFEVDIALVTRWWRGTPPTIYCSVPMESSQGDSRSNPVTCMAYFGIRDEVVTGDMSGAVTLWGPPGSSRQQSAKNPLGLPHVSVRPRGVVPLPMNCVPVAMAGQRLDGQYLAIAGMPLKSLRPYSKYCRSVAARPSSTSAPATAMAAADGAVDGTGVAGKTGNMATGAAAGTGNTGAIIVITCNENSIRWNKGEIVLRPPGIALTAITAFRNSIVAVGESAVGAAAAAEHGAVGMLTGNASAPHRLSFVDVVSGSVMRQIPKAHNDYITALTVLEESSYVLLSGGRDAAVKMWDPRSREETPVLNTAFCTAPHHEDTISSIHTTNYNIITTDVCGAMVVWDLRKMAAPHKRHKFAYPIAESALIQQNRAALATTRGIVTVALDTLEPQDLYYEGICTRLLANDAGNLLFVARQRELDVFAVSNF
ncbi:hypothetical protein, conserved [Leishmania tarentolae]|uniref:Guanine nucleotide-binding protein subunit beta-like protein n=1 Tax=Leishmania tarentolae TaxID=5689 RepID=A0A640KLK3_LEITA|nr:hypothetical protein, conserved [Leishmania tarentolae]